MTITHYLSKRDGRSDMSEQYEQETVMLRNGQRVLIRPIQADDAESVAAFVEGLSAYSRHLLFLGGVTKLSEPTLQRICEPDYERDMAFVALHRAAGPHAPAVIGLCRYASAPEPGQGAEIAVAVADAWQHNGLGTALLRRLIDYARGHGIERLFSIDSTMNHRMRTLARHLGFGERPDPHDIHQVIYSMPLPRPRA